MYIMLKKYIKTFSEDNPNVLTTQNWSDLTIIMRTFDPYNISKNCTHTHTQSLPQPYECALWPPLF